MPHRVLVVDDDDAHRRTVERALAGECSVCGVAGGVAALELLDREPVSLLLTDQRMPGMSGVELLARAAARHPQVVRMLFTAYAEVEMLSEAINAGHVYAFLGKPWQPTELRLAVRRGLQWREAQIERDALNQRLRDACAAAERDAQGKSRLLALLAHELGTPAHIALNASALLAEMELPAAARRWVEPLQRAARWMARGVAQVHRASEDQQRPLRLRAGAIDLGACLEDLVTALRAALGARVLSIGYVREDGAAPALEADPRWLREALWNLLANAVRNTPDGGHIEVRARRAGGCAAIEVTDDGDGIEADRLAAIFEPFANAGEVHLHGSGWLAYRARGLGLGLALTRRIAAAHGGRVSAESTLGAGARFRLELPQKALRENAGPALGKADAGRVAAPKS